MKNTASLPDFVFDEKGNKYLVIKPHVPDSDMWVRLILENKVAKTPNQPNRKGNE